MSENGEKPGEGPPTKKTRLEEDVEGMRSRLSFLTNLLPRFLPQGPQVIPTQNEEPQSTPLLELGECSTTIDEKKISQVTTEERVSQVNSLQHFESSEWKEVRYSEALKKLVRTPGFTELKVNNELCYLDKGKDTFLSTDRVMAGLTHVLLDQRDNIKYIMADFIDWIIENQAVLTKEDLTKVVTDNFGAGSTIFNNFEQALQVICGKRAECIENRRKRILAEIPVKNVQVALKKIPPSSEFLFAKEELTSLIISLGGAQSWLSPPPSLTPKKTFQRRETPRSSTSRSFQPSSRPRFQPPSKQGFQAKNNTTPRQPGNNSNFKPKQDFSRAKSTDSFRRKSEK
ncbi:uncharacterized protein LOC123261535 [Cotesia glomerata]|uniref:uncharacterized protein LOC123261535 n=1 Tax=Cotesia glomerata TaxID=32391 RepID=UPI001D00A814|nr:uncharacterized protein LOC123261535 [Cotesia glomerata]